MLEFTNENRPWSTASLPSPLALFCHPFPDRHGHCTVTVSRRRRRRLVLAAVRSTAAVANELKPANDLADGKEANALGSEDAASRQLDRGQGARLLQEGGRGLKELAGVLHLLPGVLEVGLERARRAVGMLVWDVGCSVKCSIRSRTGAARRTEGPSSESGRRAGRAQGRRASSRRRTGYSLEETEVRFRRSRQTAQKRGGGHTLSKGNELAGATASTAERGGEVAGSTGDDGAGGRGDAREALGSLGGGVDGGLPCLGGSV